MGLFDTLSRIALRLRMVWNKTPISVKLEMQGSAEEVMADAARLRTRNAETFVYITLRVRAVEGSWLEDVALPVIAGPNTMQTKFALETLFKQSRISKQLFDETSKAIDALCHCAHEKDWKDRTTDRYKNANHN